MEKKKEYRSSIRSRHMIREAFLELLKEKEFKKITVTDIMNRSGLNRSTFYAHYPDVYGVVEEIQDEVICRNMELIRQMNYQNILNDPIPYLQSIASMLNENIEFYKRMGHTEYFQKTLDKCRQMIAGDIINYLEAHEEIPKHSFFPIRIHFFVGGVMNTYQQWADGNLDCTTEDICKEIAEIIKKTVPELLNAGY